MTKDNLIPRVNFDDIFENQSDERIHDVSTFDKKREHIDAAYQYASEQNYYTQISNEKPSPLKNIMIQLPEDLVQQLNMYQAENNVTRKYVVMKALSDMGFKVRNIDLIKDGRSRK